MAWMHPDAVEYRRQRCMRPDAGRWLKPDPAHWLSPEELRLEYPELYERKYGGLPRRASRPTPPNTLDIIRGDETLRLRVLSLLRAAQVQIAMLRHELALRRKNRLDQLRVLAGNPGAGQWTKEGEAVHLAAERRSRITIDPSVWTGISTIDETTRQLTDYIGRRLGLDGVRS